VREAYEIIEVAMIINWCVVLRVQCTLGSTSFFTLPKPAQVTSVVPNNIGPRNAESNKRFIRFGHETEAEPYKNRD
jgi:hypothetical protein